MVNTHLIYIDKLQPDYKAVFRQISNYDALIFIGIVLAVESALMFGLFKAVDSGTKARIKWIESKKYKNL